ncbi:MAG: hypothetical protein EXS37_15725 [Opitutus sp.]|nr:hypothetical protein [Opitutus sp.]
MATIGLRVGADCHSAFLVHVALTLTLAVAAPPTVWEQIRQVPKDTWINIGICVLTVIIIVRLWGVLKKANDFAPYIAAILGSFLIFFYWIYDRSEPRFLTPVVEKLAPFFPSKGVQKNIEEKRRRGRAV